MGEVVLATEENVDQQIMHTDHEAKKGKEEEIGLIVIPVTEAGTNLCVSRGSHKVEYCKKEGDQCIPADFSNDAPPIEIPFGYAMMCSRNLAHAGARTGPDQPPDGRPRIHVYCMDKTGSTFPIFISYLFPIYGANLCWNHMAQNLCWNQAISLVEDMVKNGVASMNIGSIMLFSTTWFHHTINLSDWRSYFNATNMAFEAAHLPSRETLRLANLPRDDNTRNNSRNWSATTTRRFRHSRGTRNAPNLPNINPDRRLRNPTPATLPRGELTISRHRTALCGVCTVAGLKPGNPRWQNQDSYVISEDVPANAHQHCFAVLDGHGEVGHLVSQRCRDRLCGHFWESDLNMHRTFRLMQQDLNECNFDVKCSGATCVFAYIHGPHLRVANVGDSRGILGHLESGKICAVPLTSDHKEVWAYLVSQKLQSMKLTLTMHFSSGHATDGVWDVIDNNQAVQIVHTHLTSTRWESLSPMVDDITALVVDLQKVAGLCRLR
ncbi:hypothetical protein AURANDRAFT_66756 [Aureococcus anophagefferens]|uniref:PPM-type phosphatase domain-containing protein n=1 Tax=Aureococcus anophagefferens TaxID=44056 RepID=F0YIP1_AURAN|nr:hypothetical protein AURANDRAFT_66756 [Aureococcus anophagefferens]EGB05022.1 hypothetical protein AURANDRAFT_66756 [Aureococcus anophagefferens]|eukprot:XP_009040373.1 hypothetical protein AURANDRAFT_66756 [Aureococcus anophagefferens]